MSTTPLDQDFPLCLVPCPLSLVPCPKLGYLGICGTLLTHATVDAAAATTAAAAADVVVDAADGMRL